MHESRITAESLILTELQILKRGEGNANLGHSEASAQGHSGTFDYTGRLQGLNMPPVLADQDVDKKRPHLLRTTLSCSVSPCSYTFRRHNRTY